MGQFRDKVVWITGGGSGLGRAMAHEFARRGASVAISGRREERLRDVARELEVLGAPHLAVPCDVTDEAQVRRAVEAVRDTLGTMDVAIANAGFGVAGRIEEITPDEWRRQMNVNVVGLGITIHYAMPQLRATNGRMVLVGSVAGYVPAPEAGAYSASKYAVRAIGQALSMELVGSGVSCTTLQPGFVDTEGGRVDNTGTFRADRSDPRPRNLMWSPEKAARVMVDAIWARRREFTFTGHGRVAAFVGRHMPGLLHRFGARLNE